MHYWRPTEYEPLLVPSLGRWQVDQRDSGSRVPIYLFSLWGREVVVRMVNKLLAIAGIGILAGGLVLLIAPVSHIPLLDANRQVLAETEREGFCAGETYMKTRGAGSEPAMTECIETSTIDDEINHRQVQPGFCQGLKSAGLPMEQSECMTIMDEQEFWPTMKGTLTNSWNRRFPYPGDFLTSNVPQTGGDSRTGDRETTDREGFSR